MNGSASRPNSATMKGTRCAILRKLSFSSSSPLTPATQFVSASGNTPHSLPAPVDGVPRGIELIRPSEWLPLIWGGAAPEFAGLDEANTILGSLMTRYNDSP